MRSSGSAEVEPPTAPGGDYRVVSVHLAPEQITTPGAPQVLGSRQIFDELRNRLKSASADLILLILGTYALAVSTSGTRWKWRSSPGRPTAR